MRYLKILIGALLGLALIAGCTSNGGSGQARVGAGEEGHGGSQPPLL